MAKQKTVNYTDEQVSALKAAYVAAESYDEQQDVLKTFHEEWGKSVASLRAKLTREGVYKKKEYTNKQGGKSIRKAQKVVWLATALNTTAENVDDLEKLTHKTLDMLISKFNLEN